MAARRKWSNSAVETSRGQGHPTGPPSCGILPSGWGPSNHAMAFTIDCVTTIMVVVLHVRGEIRYGEWRHFREAAETYREYRRNKKYVVPDLLLGLSGPMNTAVLVYRYEDAHAFEKEDRAIAGDSEYGKVASQMPYREGTIVYELFREA